APEPRPAQAERRVPGNGTPPAPARVPRDPGPWGDRRPGDVPDVQHGDGVRGRRARALSRQGPRGPAQAPRPRRGGGRSRRRGGARGPGPAVRDLQGVTAARYLFYRGGRTTRGVPRRAPGGVRAGQGTASGGGGGGGGG